MSMLAKSLSERTTGFTNVDFPAFLAYCSIYQLTGLAVSSIIDLDCDPSLWIRDGFARTNTFAQDAVPTAWLRCLR